MKVEMLRSRGYRGNHLEAGIVTDMDDATARTFIASGWAREHVEPEPLAPVEADAAAPLKATPRRKALR